jgi:hypothetical protein
MALALYVFSRRQSATILLAMAFPHYDEGALRPGLWPLIFKVSRAALEGLYLPQK